MTSFTIPRKKSQRGLIEEIPLNDEIQLREIKTILNKGSLTSNDLPYKLSSVKRLNNDELYMRYRDHKAKLSNKYGKSKPLTEINGFYLIDSNKENELISDFAENGARCINNATMNFLGDSTKGIYICKYLDALLEYHQRLDIIKCFVMRAHFSTAKPVNFLVGEERCDPDINFQCQIPKEIPQKKSSILDKYSTSMRFFYDAEDYELKELPGNVLPHLILTFERDNNAYTKILINKQQLLPKQSAMFNISKREMNLRRELKRIEERNQAEAMEKLKTPVAVCKPDENVPVITPIPIRSIMKKSLYNNYKPKQRHIKFIDDNQEPQSIASPVIELDEVQNVEEKEQVIETIEEEIDDGDELDDEAYLNIDSRIRKLKTAKEMVDALINQYGRPDDNDDTMSKWRIMYERTGRLDVKFKSAKQLCVSLDDICRTKLKFMDEDKTKVNLKDSTNMLIMQYKAKKKTNRVTVYRAQPAPVEIVLVKNEPINIEPIKVAPKKDIKSDNNGFIKQLNNTPSTCREVKNEKEKNFNDMTSLERHLFKNQQLKTTTTTKKQVESTISNAYERLVKEKKIVTNNNTSNSAKENNKRFWDSSSSDEDNAKSGEINNWTTDERVFVKLNNSQILRSSSFLSYAKQYYEQNMNSMNAELLKLEAACLMGTGLSQKSYYRNNRNENVANLDVDCLRAFKSHDETSIFSNGVKDFEHIGKKRNLIDFTHVETIKPKEEIVETKKEDDHIKIEANHKPNIENVKIENEVNDDEIYGLSFDTDLIQTEEVTKIENKKSKKRSPSVSSTSTTTSLHHKKRSKKWKTIKKSKHVRKKHKHKMVISSSSSSSSSSSPSPSSSSTSSSPTTISLSSSPSSSGKSIKMLKNKANKVKIKIEIDDNQSINLESSTLTINNISSHINNYNTTNDYYDSFYSEYDLNDVVSLNEDSSTCASTNGNNTQTKNGSQSPFRFSKVKRPQTTTTTKTTTISTTNIIQKQTKNECLNPPKGLFENVQRSTSSTMNVSINRNPIVVNNFEKQKNDLIKSLDTIENEFNLKPHPPLQSPHPPQNRFIQQQTAPFMNTNRYPSLVRQPIIRPMRMPQQFPPLHQQQQQSHFGNIAPRPQNLMDRPQFNNSRFTINRNFNIRNNNFNNYSNN